MRYEYEARIANGSIECGWPDGYKCTLSTFLPGEEAAYARNLTVEIPTRDARLLMSQGKAVRVTVEVCE